MPWRGPQYPGELPTLGWYALDWFADNLIVPDGPQAFEPLILTRDQAQFVLDYYTIDPRTGRRRVRRGIYSRSKGSGKSPLLGGFGILEALGDIVPDGWDANGEPVGRPWASLGFKPKVQISAVSEDQTANTWDPILDMCRYGPVAENYDIEALDTFVSVPRGRIEFTTSAAVSREGFRPIFAVFDQTESWTKSNGGHKLASTIRRNLTKTGGSSVETPNSYRPGDESVAEASFQAARLQAEGRLRGDAGGILLSHREAPEVDLTDHDALIEALAYAYGCAAKRPQGCALHGPECNVGYVDLERVLQDIWDPAAAESDSRMYFLNQQPGAADAWLEPYQWEAAEADPPKAVKRREMISIGFDGSRRRARGVTDATALIGVRLSDGHVFTIRVWEQPADWPKKADPWEVPKAEVSAEIKATFQKYQVVGFFADPAKWETDVAQWEKTYGRQLQIRASRAHPIQWWMTGGRAAATVRALEQFHTAVVQQELTHDGSSELTRHALNARERHTRSGLQIAKETPDSPKKIDGVVAAVLAWQAHLEAVARDIKPAAKPYAAQRLR